MSAAAIRLGTRGSALALWQARHVAALLAALPGQPQVEVVTIRTTGDEVSDVPLWQVEGKAFFTRELDDALLAGRIDLAVHSLKDLATRLPDGLVLAAVPEREDPRDALVTRSGTGELASLPPGARIGTSSVRRRAFLRHHHPALAPTELRGNVPTRVAQVLDGRYDAIILAAAGLKRLGLESHVASYLDPQQFPPAAAQGALGICTRSDDAGLRALVESLEDPGARVETTAERAFLARLEAGCQVPAGVLARLQGSRLRLHGVMCETDGSAWRRALLDWPASDASGGGRVLAEQLRDWRESA